MSWREHAPLVPDLAMVPRFSFSCCLVMPMPRSRIDSTRRSLSNEIWESGGAAGVSNLQRTGGKAVLALRVIARCVCQQRVPACASAVAHPDVELRVVALAQQRRVRERQEADLVERLASQAQRSAASARQQAVQLAAHAQRVRQASGSRLQGAARRKRWR